jgi:hypothetical protein
MTGGLHSRRAHQHCDSIPSPPTLQVLNKGEVEEKEKGDGEQKEVEEKQK